MQFPAEYRTDTDQQICGEDYFRYGQQSPICRSNSSENGGESRCLPQGQNNLWNEKPLGGTLDTNDAHYDRNSEIKKIQQQKKYPAITSYRLLLAFDEVYHSATEAEQKEFMKAFIERIEMFPEEKRRKLDKEDCIQFPCAC
ncbi:MAG: hypothetical protein V8Q93_11295 [Blautia faecis]